MAKLIWGIVIMVFGVLGFITSGSNPQGPAGSILMGLLCLIGGGTLAYFGNKDRTNSASVAMVALQMIREENKISSSELAQRTGLNEIAVRQYVAKAQMKGILPYKIDIT